MAHKIFNNSFASRREPAWHGLGKIVEQLFDILKYYFPNKEIKLRNELLEQEIISLKVENLKSLGVSDEELQKIFDLRNNAILNIKDLKLSNKITNIEIKEVK